ncbi:MAG: hypothetical protein ACJAUY_001940 [Cognaticolwellia sp.]|jgi:hypothetical protein
MLQYFGAHLGTQLLKLASLSDQCASKQFLVLGTYILFAVLLGSERY